MKQLITYIAFVLLAITSCKKETKYVYGVKDVTVNQSGVNKPNVKNTLEFISIAYSDLLGQSIGASELTELSVCYLSFGDKKFIEDLIIRNFLKKPGVVIPTQTQMNGDVAAFVQATYRKFYNRDPNEFEKWQIVNYIKNTTGITPELVYYSFMTSDEYRYY
ncbi:MAG TPA: hypothetical protein VFL70_07045 [Bacteroidia bacterium]|nr:hypothetical protein [Bacteroidia bacterium]HNO71146.1 hypothetical protein [Bacteroidia bacterium]